MECDGEFEPAIYIIDCCTLSTKEIRFSSYSTKALSSELLENPEEMFPR